MRHPEFPVVSFLLLPFLLASLRSHIKARSVATVSLVVWLSLYNIIRGINSIVWANNTTIRLLVWCDITTKFGIGFTIAVPLAALCICRHLENVSSNRQAMITSDDKRRRMIFESVLCFALPLIFMALHYIVQGHRFDIVEDIGCLPNTYISVPSMVLIFFPPLVIAMISMCYAVAAFHHFLARRIEFAAILHKSNSSLSTSRYFRLMALAVFEIFWDTGNDIYVIWANWRAGLHPWISWSDVHSKFSHVGRVPLFLTPQSVIISNTYMWWILPISSIAFFIFFGFGEEALSDYRAGLNSSWLSKYVLISEMRESIVERAYSRHSGHKRSLYNIFFETRFQTRLRPTVIQIGSFNTLVNAYGARNTCRGSV
ncbi:STE-3-like pheromone receptor [Hysterangium stoloniferum]|nr:STE-3-like pheromone receptor [Hysterangium stoloniferum]